MRIIDAASVYLRLTLGGGFLSAVADRFGWWGTPGEPGVAWGNWHNFVNYTAQVNSFLPGSVAPSLAFTATILEIILGVLLLTGVATRLAALGTSLLTALFALALSFSFGPKSAIDYAVFVCSAGGLLLAAIPSYYYSVDAWLANRKRKAALAA